MTENIVKGKKYRVCTNADANEWDRVSMWTAAEDVEMANGVNVETAVSTINENLNGFQFKTEDGVNYVKGNGADTWLPFSGCMDIIGFYSVATEKATPASLVEHTFDKDYKKVFIIVNMNDLNHDNDNYCKVFDNKKADTNWTTFINDLDGAWDAYDVTGMLPSGVDMANVSTKYTHQVDKNKTTHYSWATQGITLHAFNVIYSKENVKKDETVYMYLQSMKRNFVVLIGLN